MLIRIGRQCDAEGDADGDAQSEDSAGLGQQQAHDQADPQAGHLAVPCDSGRWQAGQLKTLASGSPIAGSNASAPAWRLGCPCRVAG